jgi:hypothetical protein
LHDAGDLYGFEYLSAAIDRLRDAVLLGSAAGQKGVYDYLNNQLADMKAVIDGLVQARATSAAIINTLGYTPLDSAGGSVSGKLDVGGYLYKKAGNREVAKSLVATTAITTLNLSLANHFLVTLNANTAFRFDLSGISGLANTDYIKFSMLLKNDAVGNRTISFSTPVTWPGKAMPARAAAANAINEYEFATYDGGQTWVGKLVGSDIG